MSTTMMELWQRFRTLPRAVQWSAWAAAATIVTLLWTDVVSPWTNAWNARADLTLQKLREVSSGGDRVDRLDAMQEYVVGIGAVAGPLDQAEAVHSLAETINHVLAGHSVSDDSFNIRPPTKLPRDALAGLLGSGALAYKLTADLRFEATAEEAMAVIAEIEGRPEVEAISRVHLAKRGSSKVIADLTIEAWLLRRAERTRGGSA